MTNFNSLTRTSFKVCVLALLLLSLFTVPGVHAANNKNDQIGKFIWYDLLTDDAQKAQEFYGELFGWEFVEGKRFTAILHEGQKIGSVAEIRERSDGRKLARWIGSVSVLNIDKAVSFLHKEGGKIHEGPIELKNRGQVAFVTDPLGAQLGLVQSRKSTPSESTNTPGSWLWTELWTNDPESSIDFYSKLADFTSVEESDGYWILKSGGRWRAGVRDLFDESLEQRWVPVIQVVDVQDTLKLAIAQGGRVVLDETISSAGEHVAVLADPAGALFMVQQWRGMEQLEEGSEQS